MTFMAGVRFEHRSARHKSDERTDNKGAEEKENVTSHGSEERVG
jgi:hypothetical protein